MGPGNPGLIDIAAARGAAVLRLMVSDLISVAECAVVEGERQKEGRGDGVRFDRRG